MVTRFDLDNLDTPAVRELAAKKPVLEQSIARRRESIRTRAESMTIADIKKEITDKLGGFTDGENPKTKAEWIDLYAAKGVANTPYAKTLSELETEAFRDRYLAKGLNELLATGEKAEETMKKIHEIPAGRRMVTLQSALVDVDAASWASDIHAAVTDHNADLREITLKLIGRAVVVMSQRLRHGFVNELADAKGANVFFAMAVQRMADSGDTTIPLSYLY